MTTPKFMAAAQKWRLEPEIVAKAFGSAVMGMPVCVVCVAMSV